MSGPQQMGGASPQKAPLDFALEYAAAGLPVFPCRPNKRPYTEHGFKDASTNESVISGYWQRWPKALIGMPTGKASGIAVLDLDVKKGKDGPAAVPDWEQLTHSVARTQSGGLHLYFKNDERVRCTADQIALGVDTRGDGGYVIVPGVGGYSWIKSGDLSRLPPWPEKYLAYVNHGPRTAAVSSVAEPDQIRAALKVIPNCDLGWEEWNRVGMACWAATSGSEEGFATFDMWSRKSAKYDSAETRERWEHYSKSPPDQIGAGTLFFLANDARPGWREAYAELEKSLGRVNREGAKILDFPRDKVSVNGAGSSHQKNEPIPLHWHGEQQTITPRWLIRNCLPETGIALVSGQWGTGKTFLLLEICAAVIMGRKFLGEPTRRRGGVLIFAAEGASELPIRLAALAEAKIATGPAQGDLPFNAAKTLSSIDPKKLPIVWADQCPPLRDENLPLLIEAAEAAAKHLKEVYRLPLSAIGIDTMAAAAWFKDENDNGEAQRAMNVLRKLSERTGALVIAVDHFGKEIKTGTRGASAKEAAADAVLALLGDRKNEGHVANLRLCLRKVRGGPSGREFPFRLATVALGKDEDGYPIDSCVVEWTVDQERGGTSNHPPRSSLLFCEVLTAALGEHGKQVKPSGEDSKPIQGGAAEACTGRVR